MMRPISNRNGLIRDLITLTFGAEYVLQQNIVRKNDILLILPVKYRGYSFFCLLNMAFITPSEVENIHIS